MLIGIPPLLTPQLLWALAAMGHGDDLALVDAHHPAERIAQRIGRPPVHLPGHTTTEVAAALLALMPVDDFTADPLRRMQVVGAPDAVPPVQREMQRVVKRAVHRREHRPGEGLAWASVDRDEFYRQAERSFVIVQTGDLRPYGCFLLRKGLVGAKQAPQPP